MTASSKVLVLVGALPPPIGGVSIFVERTLRLWRDQQNLEVVHVQPRHLLRLISQCIGSRKAEFHVNTLHWLMLLILFLTGTLPRTTIYDHNHSRRLQRSSLKARLTYWLLGKANQIRIANPALAEGYLRHGIAGNRISVFLPFVPPVEADEAALLSRLPGEVQRLLERPSGMRLVINSAWKLVRGTDDADLYGFSSTIALARKLADVRDDIHFLFFLGTPPSDEFSCSLVRQIQGLNNATLVMGNHVMWPALKHADLFLRTTSTDGDSVALREALYFGVPVVASDVTGRPVGVTLYEFANPAALYSSVIRVLDRQPTHGSTQT